MHYNGLFKPGLYHDISIFRKKLKKMLLGAGEKVEGDLGYCSKPETVHHAWLYISKSNKRAKITARTYYKTVNRRLKHFECLNQPYRYDLGEHKILFCVVFVATQLFFTAVTHYFKLNINYLPKTAQYIQ